MMDRARSTPELLEILASHDRPRPRSSSVARNVPAPTAGFRREVAAGPDTRFGKTTTDNASSSVFPIVRVHRQRTHRTPKETIEQIHRGSDAAVSAPPLRCALVRTTPRAQQRFGAPGRDVDHASLSTWKWPQPRVIQRLLERSEKWRDFLPARTAAGLETQRRTSVGPWGALRGSSWPKLMEQGFSFRKGDRHPMFPRRN